MKRNVSTWVKWYLTSRKVKERYLQIHQVNDFFIVQSENSFENDDVRSIDCFGSFFSWMSVEIIYRDLHWFAILKAWDTYQYWVDKELKFDLPLFKFGQTVEKCIEIKSGRNVKVKVASGEVVGWDHMVTTLNHSCT